MSASTATKVFIAAVLPFYAFAYYLNRIYQEKKGRVWCEKCQLWAEQGDCLCWYREEWRGFP